MLRTVAGVLRAIIAAGWCLLAAVTVLVTLPIAPRNGSLFLWYTRIWARGVLRICGIRLTVSGTEHITPGTCYVYVSNHASLFDIPVVAGGIPDRVRIIYKKELERIPIFGWALKAGAYIAINRQRSIEAMQALDEAAERIRTGTSVILYAEGTRTLTGALQPFKRGAFNLALRAGVPVVPLTINGTFHILPKHSISVRPGTVHLILDPPIPPTADRGRDAELRLMEKVRVAIASHYIDQSVHPDGSHPA